ncbi:hypothetical protein T492DRAFT_906367 [Pavlovales sp. CCMP2436]|nr:hypothetical protein T492DRAFT_906367 [Pavlovales sp. CCMP2436]
MSDSRPSAGAELAPPPPRWRTGTLGRSIALAMALTLLLLTLQLGRVGRSGARTVPLALEPAAAGGGGVEVQVRLPTDRSADRSPAQALQRAADFVSGDGQPSREAAPAPGVSSAPAGARAQTQRGARSADGGKPPLSYEDVAAQFANASFIRAEAAAFDLRCRGYRAQWEKLLVTSAFARLERVLIVDVTRPSWNGLGNSLDRWLNLFRLGHAHGRATFLRMDPCSAPLPPHLGLLALRPDSPACKFDLGQFFHADRGWQWAWDQRAASAVREAMSRGLPDASAAPGGAASESVALWSAKHLHYRCTRTTWTCTAAILTDGATGVVIDGEMEEMQEGKVAAKLFALFDEADRAARSEGQRRAAAAGVSGASAVVALTPASVVVLSIESEQTSLQQETMHKSVRERGRLFDWGGMGMCERHSLTRPRPVLQRALLPALRELEGAELAVAIHTRTGYADWQKYAPEQVAPRQQPRTHARADGREGGGTSAPERGRESASYAPGSHAAHWAELERLLLDCREANAALPAAGEGGAAAAAALRRMQMCFRYKMGPPPFIANRSVNAADAARCALEGEHVLAAIEPPGEALLGAEAVLAAMPPCDALGPGRRGPLAATVACAAMHARRALAHLEPRLAELLGAKAFARPAAGATPPPLSLLAVRARAKLGTALTNASLDSKWRLVVLGDAPAVHSLLRGAAYLRGRAVSLEGVSGAGALGHTVYASSCRLHATGSGQAEGRRLEFAAGAARGGGTSARGARRRRRLQDSGTRACVRGADPRGAWSRSIADMYLGGLASAMVRLLFSSYPGAVTMRSVMIRGGTQFYADYDPRSAHRDKPPTNMTSFAVLGAVGPYE